MAKKADPKENMLRREQEQIERYREVERPRYKTYAKTLQGILSGICDECRIEGIVQARAKTVASFAGKMVRRRKRTDDALHTFTDLAGARVIVNTQAEVARIGKEIRAHFKIDEPNSQDVGERLKAAEFGYLSVHYIVQVDRPKILGTKVPLDQIEDRKAEIQVRTFAQHVWAAIGHDRVYKSEFRVPQRWLREYHRVAALLEEADVQFGRVIEGLDAYKLNYGAYLNKEQMADEIEKWSVIMRNEDDDDKRPGHALRIARIARAAADWPTVVDVLTPFAKDDKDYRDKPAIWLELGHALCHAHCGDADAETRKLGRRYLTQAGRPDEVDLAAPPCQDDPDTVRAEALAQLAWSHRHDVAEDELTRTLYRKAFHCDPSNPYHFTSYLEYEIHLRGDNISEIMAPAILAAIATCRAHADAGIELPWAYLTMGKLYLLLGRPYDSLAAYAKAVHLRLDKDTCLSEDAYQAAELSLKLLNPGRPLPREYEWARQLLLLGRASCASAKDHLAPLVRRKPPYREPVLIIAGGASAELEQEMRQYTPHLRSSLEGFEGTIISGGTRSGIPGIVGSIVASMRRKGNNGTTLIGYHPPHPPIHVSLDKRYDERIQVAEGDDFSPAEPLQCWIDLIAAGVDPANVRVLGVNGGNIAAFEYRLALALGATVGVIESSGRAVADLLPDVDWWDAKNLLWLPLDKDVIRAFVCQKPSTLTPAALDRAARAVHEAFVADKLSERSAPSVQPWPSLRDDFKESNRGQVAFAEEVLRSVGYAVRKATPGADVPHPRFTDAEIEKMARLEHGRFVVERLGQGWRFGPHKDEANKVSPFLVPWADLSDNVREYDREAVRNYPNILAEARREIHRIRKGR